MQVTSDCLFHFTDSRKSLETILSDKFKLAYCKETVELNDLVETLYIPMISFSDVPLVLARDQIKKYGGYGIGLSKSWGISNRLNPVVYVEKNSIPASDLMEHIQHIGSTNKHFDKMIDKTKDTTELKDLERLFNDYTNLVASSFSWQRYIKNYQGDLIRKNKVYKNYRYYDEREWRYASPYKYGDKWNLTEKEYLKYRGKGKQKPLLNEFTINFTASDVKYLIVKSSKDIPILIRKIKSLTNLCSSPDESDVLTTKILTIEQLDSDF